MFKKIKSFVGDVKFYKSLGPNKTYIQTKEQHRANGDVITVYHAIYMTNPYVEWEHHMIGSDGELWWATECDTLCFDTEEGAKAAVDLFIEKKDKKRAEEVVKTTFNRKGYP